VLNMTINYKDINLSYQKYGDSKDVIVILPGWGETRNTFLEMINILKIVYTVYIIDYPVFVETIFSNYNLIMNYYKLMIIKFINDLKKSNPNIVNHSFGGKNDILLTYKYNVYNNNLILIDSAGIKPKMTLKKKFRLKLYKTLQTLADYLPTKFKHKFKTYL